MATNGGSKGSVADIAPRRGDRDLVLVCAAEPLRSAVAELVRERGYEPRVSVAPLQAIGALLDVSDRIEHAVISSGHDWSVGLYELIEDEYPDVHAIMLVA